MSHKFLTVICMTCFIFALGCTTRNEPDKNRKIHHSGYSIPVNEKSVAENITGWNKASKTAAEQMISKYGLPSIASSEMLIWYNTGPFAQTVVYQQAVPHSFPIPHEDVIQQTIRYRVPRDKIDDLSELDGSLVVDRVKGELSARNDKEEMNYLALNLADKIVRGEISVEEARVEYLNSTKEFSSGTTNRYLTKLNFKTEGNTADPGNIADPGQISIQAQEEARDARRKIEMDKE